jgi:universal stress protein A
MRVLVALDYSDCSKMACRWVALRLAALRVSEVIFHHAVDNTTDELVALEKAIGKLREFVADACEDPFPSGIEVRYAVTAGSAADEILGAAAHHKVDAIVMGTHGRRGLDRLLIGSVAESVVRMAPCTVVVVKPGPAA